MKSIRVVFLLVCVIVTVVSGVDKIPEYLKLCHRSDPKVEDCILNSLEAIKPYLIRGIPENNIPQLDPLLVEEVLLSEKSVSGFGLKLRNILITGAAEFQLSQLKYDRKKETYTFLITIPVLKLKGEYDIDGIIFGLPMKGTGPFTAEFGKISGNVKMKVEIVPMNGIRRMIIRKLKIRLQFGSGKMHVENIFKNDQNLGNAINDLINDNFKEVSQTSIPLVEKIVSERIMKVANTLAARLDYDQFFPE